MSRWAATLGFLGLLALADALASVAPAAAGDVALTVRAGGSPLDCLFEYAHWVTEAGGTLTPGSERVFELHVAAADGTVSKRNVDGVDMAIEVFTCYPAGRWREARFALPLEVIRAAGPALRLDCHDEGGFHCTVTAGTTP